LGLAELFGLFAKEPPRQGVQFLAQQSDFALSLRQGLPLLLHFLPERGVFSLKRIAVHLTVKSDGLRTAMFNLLTENYYLLRGRFIPSAPGAVFEINAVEQQLQPLWRQADFDGGFAGTLRPVERPFFQTLGQKANARAVKIKNFDPIVSTVTEDKKRAPFGVFAQLGLRGGPQAVERKAQIARRDGQEHFEMGVKT
jgi:hypothetical protein